MVIRRYGRGVGDETQLALALAQPFLGCAAPRFFPVMGGYISRPGDSERWIASALPAPTQAPPLKPPKPTVDVGSKAADRKRARKRGIIR
jgi:hypothetical protein